MGGASHHYTYTVSTELIASPHCAAFVVLLKRPIPIDPSIPLSEQVTISTLPGFLLSNGTSSQDGAPFDFIHSHIQIALEPYFDSYNKTKSQRNPKELYGGKGDGDSRTGISAAKKKMAE